MVVDLAVENNPHGPIFVAEGLVSGGKIDDAKAPHADPDATGAIYPVVVRSAMDYGGAHPPQNLRLNLVASEMQDPNDAAHILLFASSQTATRQLN